jgi:hypothetical protein
VVFIELKSSNNPRVAIRHALGQLLEYGFYSGRSDNGKHSMELMIVGQGSLTPDARRYLDTLRRRFRLPVVYRTFAPGDEPFTL